MITIEIDENEIITPELIFQKIRDAKTENCPYILIDEALLPPFKNKM